MQRDQKVLVFGELLIRVSSETEFLTGKCRASTYPGGSEANVSASLSQSGIQTTYITACPENALADAALNALSRLGTDTAKAIREGSRIGLYFLLSPNGLTNGEVVYDRRYSSFSMLRPGQINWDDLMKGHTWFHWSALTPSLSPELASVIAEALEAAHRNGLKVSVDLNYRSKLWDYGMEPIAIMPDLVKRCHVIMGNIWAADKMLGTGVNESLNRSTSSDNYFAESTKTAEKIFNNFPVCEHIANTFRFMDNSTHNLFYGTYHNRNGNYCSTIMETNEVIDRIGSGDAFMAGLIYGIYKYNDCQQIIETATEAGFQKLFVKGDFGVGNFNGQ